MVKNTHLWLPAHVRSLAPSRSRAGDHSPTHVMFCFADHFEPMWGAPAPPYQQEVRRVDRWMNDYGTIAARHRDADNSTPRHTLFYAAEQYRSEHLNKLASCCREGWAEVEIHLHHDNDTDHGLEQKIETFKAQLREHGLLSTFKSQADMVGYGFVHGDWALDNSSPDGRWCGVNNELQVLRRTGCYADFTLPSAPSDTQTRKINSIYYATDDALRPKSHDTGSDVTACEARTGDLMIVQGPLTLNWRRRKWSIFPRIENADVCHTSAPTPDRIDLWVRQRIRVVGRPDWVFVKVSTHGLQEQNLEMLRNGAIDTMFTHFERAYNDGKEYLLHYVTAREMYNIIKAAEAGFSGNPNLFRDYRYVFRGAARRHVGSLDWRSSVCGLSA